MALLALFSSACTSRHVTRVARLDTGHGDGTVLTRAPESAAYKVKYADAYGEGLRTVGGAKRIVRRGDPLGFTLLGDGTVVAVAGDERFPLRQVPASARYCVWTCSEKRPTQFSREVGKAAGAAITVPLMGALFLGTAYLDSQDLDEDEKEQRERHRFHKEQERIGRWLKANEFKPPGWRPAPAPY